MLLYASPVLIESAMADKGAATICPNGGNTCGASVVLISRTEAHARALSLLPRVTSELKKRGIPDAVAASVSAVQYNANNLHAVWAAEIEPNAKVVMVGSDAVAQEVMMLARSISTVVYVNDDASLVSLREKADAVGSNMVIASLMQNLTGKQLEIMTKLAVTGSTFCFLKNEDETHPLQLAARARKLATLSISVNTLFAEVDFARSLLRCSVVFVPASGKIYADRQKIAAKISDIGVPALYERAVYTEFGGLLAYEADHETSMNGMYDAVAEVLKGLSARELSDIRSHRYNLVVNRNALGKLHHPLSPDLLRLVTRWN